MTWNRQKIDFLLFNVTLMMKLPFWTETSAQNRTLPPNQKISFDQWSVRHRLGTVFRHRWLSAQTLFDNSCHCCCPGWKFSNTTAACRWSPRCSWHERWSRMISSAGSWNWSASWHALCWTRLSLYSERRCSTCWYARLVIVLNEMFKSTYGGLDESKQEYELDHCKTFTRITEHWTYVTFKDPLISVLKSFKLPKINQQQFCGLF